MSWGHLGAKEIFEELSWKMPRNTSDSRLLCSARRGSSPAWRGSNELPLLINLAPVCFFRFFTYTRNNSPSLPVNLMPWFAVSWVGYFTHLATLFLRADDHWHYLRICICTRPNSLLLQSSKPPSFPGTAKDWLKMCSGNKARPNRSWRLFTCCMAAAIKASSETLVNSKGFFAPPRQFYREAASSTERLTRQCFSNKNKEKKKGVVFKNYMSSNVFYLILMGFFSFERNQ